MVIHKIPEGFDKIYHYARTSSAEIASHHVCVQIEIQKYVSLHFYVYVEF